MATSGSRAFTPTFGQLLTEAFARCEIRPENIVQEHIEQAILSGNLLLVELAGHNIEQYQLTEQVITLVNGTAIYNLPAGAIDVWSAIVRKDDSDTPVWPLSRDDYHTIPNKTTEGRPFNYFVDRAPVGETVRTITFWPVPDGTTATSARLWVWRRAEAVQKLSNDPGVAWEALDLYAAGLAKRIAMKYAAAKVQQCEKDFDRALILGKRLTRNRAPSRMRGAGYLGRGRVV